MLLLVTGEDWRNLLFRVEDATHLSGEQYTSREKFIGGKMRGESQHTIIQGYLFLLYKVIEGQRSICDQILSQSLKSVHCVL